MSRPSVFVLVHGAFHGGWCWRRVTDRLQKAGHRVFTPTLTGLGERRHLLTREVNLDTQIRDVIEVLEAEELENIVLAGHSYGGIVITGVAARVPKRIRQLVYLDAVLLEEGQSWSDALAPEMVAARRKAAAESSNGLTLPVPRPEFYGVEEPADQAWVGRRTTPHPFAAFDQKVRWNGPIGNGLPRVYVDCTQPPLPGIAAMKDRYRGKADWPFIEIKTGHDLMVSAPEETARILLRYA